MLLYLFVLTSLSFAQTLDGPDFRLQAIDQLLVQKNYPEAIQKAIQEFGVDHSNCLDIQVKKITDKTLQGEEISARTSYDQVITLDPDQFPFKSARFLVSTLIHESAHCRQHQKIYEQLLSRDKELSELSKVKDLKTLAMLDELANDSNKMEIFKQKTDGLLSDSNPKKFMTFTQAFVKGALIYDQAIGDIIEMQACLEAFAKPDILPPPSEKNKAIPEFAFQFRYLMNSFMAFRHKRLLMGSNEEEICNLQNLVPFQLQKDLEEACTQSRLFLKKYLDNVPE